MDADLLAERAYARATRPDLVGAPEPVLYVDGVANPEYRTWWYANLPDDYERQGDFG